MRQKELIELGITGVLVIVMIFAFGSAAKKSRLRAMKNAQLKSVGLAALPVVRGGITDSNNLYNLLEQQAKSIELKRDSFTAAPIIIEKICNPELF